MPHPALQLRTGSLRLASACKPPPFSPMRTYPWDSAYLKTVLDSTAPSSHTGAEREEGQMHARLSRFAGLDPERIEETARQFEEGSLEALAQQPGFRGITVGVN